MSKRVVWMVGLCVLVAPLAARSQGKPADTGVATASPTNESEVPAVPGLSSFLEGFNGGVTVAGSHDSLTGWQTFTTPAVGYSFNHIFSADVSVPIYFFRLSPTTAARPKPNALLITEHGEIGDVVLAGHAHFSSSWFEYQATGALAMPTGAAKDGLTTGLTSFDFSNHFEHSWWKLAPNLDIGLGDSATLVNRITTRNYTPSLGPLSHYQIGVGVELPFGASFESEAYEQLPVGDQKTYGLAKNGKSTVVTGRKIFEDNGFVNSLDIPLGSHMTLSTNYARSLRFHTDTFAVGYTYVLRKAPPAEPETTIDDLIRPATVATP